jgi:hypothetical protein
MTGAVVGPDRLARILRVILDERKFLSPFGVRSLSRIHREALHTRRYGRAAATSATRSRRSARRRPVDA